MNIQRMSIPLFFLFSAFACSPSSESSRIDRSEIPSSYKIVIGEGGGFAGLWTGYSILPGDTLLEWHGRTPEENAVFAGTLLPTPSRFSGMKSGASKSLIMLRLPFRRISCRYCPSRSTARTTTLAGWFPQIVTQQHLRPENSVPGVSKPLTNRSGTERNTFDLQHGG